MQMHNAVAVHFPDIEFRVPQHVRVKDKPTKTLCKMPLLIKLDNHEPYLN